MSIKEIYLRFPPRFPGRVWTSASRTAWPWPPRRSGSRSVRASTVTRRWPGKLSLSCPQAATAVMFGQDRGARHRHRRHEVLPGRLQRRVQGLREGRDHELRSLRVCLKIIEILCISHYLWTTEQNKLILNLISKEKSIDKIACHKMKSFYQTLLTFTLIFTLYINVSAIEGGVITLYSF